MMSHHNFLRRKKLKRFGYYKNGVNDHWEVPPVKPICLNILLPFSLFSMLSTETSITFLWPYLNLVTRTQLSNADIAEIRPCLYRVGL